MNLSKLLILQSIFLIMLSSEIMAKGVSIPLKIDAVFLQRLAEQTLFTGPGYSSQLASDEIGCNSITLREPNVSIATENLRIVSQALIKTGTPLGDSCLSLPDWNGIVEVWASSSISTDKTRIEFTILDSNLYNLNMEKTATGGRLWDWAKAYVHPHMAKLVIDLQPAIGELREMLPYFLPRDDAAGIDAMFASMHLDTVAISDNALQASIHIDVPTINTPAPTSEPDLTQQEIQTLLHTLDQWDAFLTFVIKQAASATLRPELRQALFDVMVGARYDLVAVITQPADMGRDPVRELFLHSWSQLLPVLTEIGAGLPGDRAMRFLAFITATDALRVIDELGPITGWDISVDGLRRLARMMVVDSTVDPLRFDHSSDLELKDLFDIGLPAPFPNVDTEPEPLIVPAPINSPPNDNPGQTEEMESDQPLSNHQPSADPGWDVLDWFINSAHSAALDTPLAKQLNKIIPDRNNVNEYLPLVKELLHDTINDVLKEKALESEFHSLFRPLVLATAWQETCWRQYKRVGDKRQTMRSGAGAVGMMQIMPRVWRGFYDTKALSNNIAYNASAGTEILLHYLVRYAISKSEHTETGNVDNLARATYAAYNGGPKHLRRYRSKKTSKSLREIDDSFWQKYQTVKSGNELAVAGCFTAP